MKKIIIVILGGGLLFCGACTKAGQQISLWEQAQQIRTGSGGFEAETNTWNRKDITFSKKVSSQEQWTINIDGDTRPDMKSIKIKCTKGLLKSPFILCNNNYDFRSVPKLINSVTKKAQTDQEKALAIRELLIGEGFYFHHGIPPTKDPIHRLTNSGYGFCGIHAEIFHQLCQSAGLQSAIVGHGFAHGHVSNEVYYDGQWHFFDTNTETLFYRSDGAIPSYKDIFENPNLLEPGDMYGQSAVGICGTRYCRALYITPPIKRTERNIPKDKQYATLDFTLRKNESITWLWQDADFTHYRSDKNGSPIYGKGIIEYHPQTKDISSSNKGLSCKNNGYRIRGNLKKAVITIPVNMAYPATEINLSAKTKNVAFIDVSVSKDNGKNWIDLKNTDLGNDQTIWKKIITNPDNWTVPADNSKLKKKKRIMTTGQYGYIMRIVLNRNNGISPSLSDINLKTIFRHYPPALAFLKIGDNTINYTCQSKKGYQADITIQWQQKERKPSLSVSSIDYGFSKPQPLTHPSHNAQLPTFAASKSKTYLLYTIEENNLRRIIYRFYEQDRWTEPAIIETFHQTPSHPVGTIDSEENLWVAYQTARLWDNSDIYVVCIKPDDTQTQPVMMNSEDKHHIAFFPSISSYKNKVAVAWEGGQNDVGLEDAWGTEVGWVRIFDGTDWDSPILIKGESFTNLCIPKILYDSKARLHLTATKGPRYYFAIEPNLKPLQWLTTEWMYHSRGGSFFEDSKGNTWAIFDGQVSGTTNEIYCRMLPASAADTSRENWINVIRISEDDKKPSIYPVIAGIDECHLVTAWMDYRNKNTEIYAKIYKDKQWSPDILISNGAPKEQAELSKKMTPNQILLSKPKGLTSEHPQMTINKQGTLWIAWQDKTSDSSQIMICRYDFQNQ